MGRLERVSTDQEVQGGDEPTAKKEQPIDGDGPGIGVIQGPAETWLPLWHKEASIVWIEIENTEFPVFRHIGLGCRSGAQDMPGKACDQDCDPGDQKGNLG